MFLEHNTVYNTKHWYNLFVLLSGIKQELTQNWVLKYNYFYIAVLVIVIKL